MLIYNNNFNLFVLTIYLILFYLILILYEYYFISVERHYGSFVTRIVHFLRNHETLHKCSMVPKDH